MKEGGIKNSYPHAVREYVWWKPAMSRKRGKEKKRKRKASIVDHGSQRHASLSCYDARQKKGRKKKEKEKRERGGTAKKNGELQTLENVRDRSALRMILREKKKKRKGGRKRKRRRNAWSGWRRMGSKQHRKKEKKKKGEEGGNATSALQFPRGTSRGRFWKEKKGKEGKKGEGEEESLS